MSRITDFDSQATVATLFAGPGNASNLSSSVSENVGFRFVLDRTVQTLSTNGLPSSGYSSGLLFVPDLSPQDPCNAIGSSFIPPDVTRHKDVSSYGYPVIGLAPWISLNCTQSFLAASRGVGTEALVFFQPSSTETGTPPPPSDQRWSLNDGDQWRTQNDYPVYAIPGPAGLTLIHELAWFSDGRPKNRSSHNRQPSAGQTRSDTNQRLFAMIESGQKGNVSLKTPKELGTFAGIIIATIVGICLLALIIYRTIRPWLLLRHQVNQPSSASAAQTPFPIDAERLPLEILTAPRDLVESMPLYVYYGPVPQTEPKPSKADVYIEFTEQDAGDKTATPSVNDEAESSKDPARIRKPEPVTINPATDEITPCPTPNRLRDAQTTCAICLEDFVVGASRIRELPCGHVFDSACVDLYLTEHSRKCPVCKQSILKRPKTPETPVTDAIAVLRDEEAARNAT